MGSSNTSLEPACRAEENAFYRTSLALSKPEILIFFKFSRKKIHFQYAAHQHLTLYSLYCMIKIRQYRCQMIHRSCIKQRKRSDPVSVTLTYFSRSQTHFCAEVKKRKIVITLLFLARFRSNFTAMDSRSTPSFHLVSMTLTYFFLGTTFSKPMSGRKQHAAAACGCGSLVFVHGCWTFDGKTRDPVRQMYMLHVKAGRWVWLCESRRVAGGTRVLLRSASSHAARWRGRAWRHSLHSHTPSAWLLYDAMIPVTLCHFSRSYSHMKMVKPRDRL